MVACIGFGEAKAPIAWGAWYRSRFIRLYPMYWLAHLVYLVSPFVERLEPVDYRFLISLTGLRMIDISSNFFYLNAAWWYFAMLIQLYLIFPILYLTMRKIGLAWFVVVAFAVGFFTRYLLLEAEMPCPGSPSSRWGWCSECYTFAIPSVWNGFCSAV